MSDLDTHIRALLGNENDPGIIKKAQRIGQKCQNNKTFEKILSYVAQSKGEEPQKDQSKQTQEKKADRNEELYTQLAERRDAVNKAKKALDEKLSTLNELSSTKTRLLDEYSLGLSQTSSESMMEPMMKLKKFVKNEEELQATENKCENLNNEIKEKTQEAHESLEKLTIREKDSQDARPEDPQKSQKVDDSYAEKLIREFIESKRRNVLEDLENREAIKDKINERRVKYDQIRAEFAKTLEAQEPYLKQKIEDSVQKTINIEEKKATVKKLQGLVSNLKSGQSQESTAAKKQETKAAKQEEPKEISETKTEERSKDEEIAKLISQNKDTLRHVQASKIRINEFVANTILAALEDIQKASKGLEANLAITFENWEKIYMLPADVYYTNMPEENYSPILQEMLNLLNKPNKAYFYLPKLIKKIVSKLGEESSERLHLENAEAEDELKTNQRVYQQKKRKQISELIEVSREFESEILYKERLENLLEMSENPPTIACADILRQYEGWTLSDYVAKWKKLFGPLSNKEDY